MAQYDGSIRIGTGINTAGIKKGVQEIAKDLERLKSIQKEFLDIGGSKEDSTYKEREKEIKKLEQASRSLNDTQKETRRQEQIPDKHWNQLKTDVEKYARALKELQSQGKFFGDEDYDKAYLAWKNATDAVKAYQAELNKQTESGQAKTAEQEAKAAERREAAQRKAEEQAEKALQKENARIQKEAEMQAKLREEAAEEERLAQIRANAVASNDEIIAKVERIKQLEQEIADLEAAETTLGYADYEDRITELSELKHDVNEYKNSLSEVPERFSKMRAAAQRAFDAVRSGLSMVGSLGKKAFSGLFNMAKRAFSAITNGSKKSNVSLSGGLKMILKYGLGIRSVYVLFNKIRTGIKDGFVKLMNYSGNFADSIQSVKNSMSTLANQIAAAFSPIVQMVIPWVNSLISALSTAMAYAAQFIGALAGGSTFTRAKKVQDSYNKSLDGTAKAADKARGALAKFDDLNVLQKQENTSGDVAGAAGNMFEEIPISDRWKNIADWFQEMWEDSDFYALGKLLGEKLRDALDSIDWAPIKETAQKIGKSLGTLINGIVEVDGLADSIGRTIGEAISTALTGLNSFLDNTHWDSAGKFIGEGLNGLLDTINWSDLGHFFAEKWNAAFEAIGEAARTFDWVKLGTSLAQSINTWIADFNWAENGAHLGEVIKGLLDALITSIGETDWQALGNGVADFIGSIDWSGIMERLAEGIGAALGGLTAFLWGLIEDAWNSVVDWWHEVAYKDGDFTIKGLLNGILHALVNINTWIKEHIVDPFIDGFRNAFGIHSPSTVMAEMGGYIIEGLINGLLSLKDKPIETIKEIGSNLIEGFRSLFGIHSPSTVMDENGAYLMEGLANGIYESMFGVLEIFDMLGMAVTEILTPMSENVVVLFTEMTAMILKSWMQMLSQTQISWTELNALITKSLLLVNAKILNGMAAALSNWTSRWSQLTQKTREACQEIIGAVSTMNDSVRSMCDSMIAAINSVKAAASSLGSIGGGDWGGGISTASVESYSLGGIPQLATGAVIRGGNPFMAILGDQRVGQTNVEAPAGLIKDMVAQGIAEAGIGSRESIPVNINIIYDGETTARVMIPDILSELSRQGYDVNLLGYT